MFTKRYLSLPVIVFNVGYDAKLGIDIQTGGVSHSYVKLNPFEISAYRPATEIDGNGDEIDVVIIQTKSGDDYTVTLDLKKFEEKIDKWASQ